MVRYGQVHASGGSRTTVLSILNDERCGMTTVSQAPVARNTRLTTPLIRRDGELQPASWEEALALVASRFGEIKSRHGGEGFAFFSCSKATNEVNFLAQKFMRTVLGSNNIDSCNRT
jgi:predicted molibdopterin-dependent oxidoreductase YjgC